MLGFIILFGFLIMLFIAAVGSTVANGVSFMGVLIILGGVVFFGTLFDINGKWSRYRWTEKAEERRNRRDSESVSTFATLKQRVANGITIKEAVEIFDMYTVNNKCFSGGMGYNSKFPMGSASRDSCNNSNKCKTLLYDFWIKMEDVVLCATSLYARVETEDTDKFIKFSNELTKTHLVYGIKESDFCTGFLHRDISKEYCEKNGLYVNGRDSFQLLQAFTENLILKIGKLYAKRSEKQKNALIKSGELLSCVQELVNTIKLIPGYREYDVNKNRNVWGGKQYERVETIINRYCQISRDPIIEECEKMCGVYRNYLYRLYIIEAGSKFKFYNVREERDNRSRLCLGEHPFYDKKSLSGYVERYVNIVKIIESAICNLGSILMKIEGLEKNANSEFDRVLSSYSPKTSSFAERLASMFNYANDAAGKSELFMQCYNPVGVIVEKKSRSLTLLKDGCQDTKFYGVFDPEDTQRKFCYILNFRSNKIAISHDKSVVFALKSYIFTR